MEIKVNINLDFMEELFNEDGESIGCSLSDAVRRDIISQVTDRVFDIAKVSLNEEINKSVANKMTELTEKTYQQMMDMSVKVTDQYGDVKEEGTIKELIKNRFDNWLEEKVDDCGKTGYRADKTRLAYYIQKYGISIADKRMQDSMQKITKDLEEKLSDDFREIIGQKIADKIGLNKLLPKKLR